MICQWRADQLFAKVLFNEYLREAKRSAFFLTQERSQEGENMVSFTQEQDIICSQTPKPNSKPKPVGRHCG